MYIPNSLAANSLLVTLTPMLARATHKESTNDNSMSPMNAYSNILAGFKNTLIHSPAATADIAVLVVITDIRTASGSYLHCC